MDFHAIVESTDLTTQMNAVVAVSEGALPQLVRADFHKDRLDIRDLRFDRTMNWSGSLALYFFATHGQDLILVINNLLENVAEEIYAHPDNIGILRLVLGALCSLRSLVASLLKPTAHLFANRSCPDARSAILVARLKQVQAVDPTYLKLMV